MQNNLITFPLVARPNFSDPSWVEQRQREHDGLSLARLHTRPLLVIRNEPKGERYEFAARSRTNPDTARAFNVWRMAVRPDHGGIGEI